MNHNHLKPFFSFYGSKFQLARHYPAPLHGKIVEPFAGSAGYSLYHPNKQVMLFDLDSRIVETWQYLIGVRESEILGLPDLLVGETTHDLPVCSEAKHLIGWWLNTASTIPKRSMSARMRSGKGAGFWGSKIRQRIADQLQYIRHWMVGQSHYSAVPEMEATWFVDPPYQLAGKYYSKSSKEIDFDDLSWWCRSLPGQVIVCENTGAHWLPFEPFKYVTNMRGKRSQEAVWCSGKQE
jgi:hypothetical protein